MKQPTTWNEALAMREVKSLKILKNHINVIKIKEMSLKEKLLYIVFEYCDNNLYEAMKEKAAKNEAYTNEQVRDLMFQAVQAIFYIHKNGFMHRDIKPENFLIKKQDGFKADVILKLADFGLARGTSDR